MSSSVVKLVSLFVLLVTGFKSTSQVKPLYNWKGTSLSLYEKPDTGSRILVKIPKGGAVQKSNSTAVLPAFNVVLSYYGSTAHLESNEALNTDGTWYSMPGKWIQVDYDGKIGYVPGLFLSRLQDLTVYKAINNDFENITAGYMNRLFGISVSKQKKELPKQSKEEISYEKTYRYKNGNYYTASFNYAEEGGAGGENYTFFLKGLKKHEAVLFLLKLTSFNNIMPDEVKRLKKRVSTNSLYDQFCWWYHKNLPEADKTERNIDMEFFYEQEGGSATVTLKETREGVIISYGFGGC